MSFIEDAKRSSTLPGPRCTVGTWAANQDDVSLEDIATARAEGATISGIWREMKARGFQGSNSPIERHLKGLCACSRTS